MMISTKGRYALRIMVDLAQHDGEMPVSVREIAQRQDISGKYMEQIISVLTRSGLLRSVRGAQGGYELARAPEDITICDIITAAEGPIALVDCLLEGEKAAHCARASECVTRGIWEKVCDSINDVLASITLADLCKGDGRKRMGCAG